MMVDGVDGLVVDGVVGDIHGMCGRRGWSHTRHGRDCKVSHGYQCECEHR
jgi:hypothetical protein